MANEDTNNQEDKEQILESYNKFKNYLGDQVSEGKKLGMDEEQLAESAKNIAEYLARNEDPRNREEKVLKEVWSVAENEDEKETLAKLLVRLAQQTN